MDKSSGAHSLYTFGNLLLKDALVLSSYSSICDILSIDSGGLWAEAEVTGVVGRAITIDCRYGKQTYSRHRKYWCRGHFRSTCKVVIDTRADNGQRGNFSIVDNARDGVFTVTMKNLNTRDTGWYCTEVSKCIYTSYFSDTLRATQSVTGVVGRAITIDCHYQKQWYRNNKKYWCWGYYRDSCQVVIDTKANNGRRGRFSITDNRDGVFTVTMENLTTGDAGWYNCGIEIPVFDPMFGVELHVSEGKLSELLILILMCKTLICESNQEDPTSTIQ
uniref:Immunoglobulin domain-containing protein n=1 Tax=Callorhinchus milii TaxID=7868 RepID=A0A4W3K2A1_CALMI